LKICLINYQYEKSIKDTPRVFITYDGCLQQSKKISSPDTEEEKHYLSAEIDGELTEWNSQLFSYDKESKISYAVTNDEENIYIAIKTEDKIVQMKLLLGGCKISLDIKAKKNDNTAVLYPMPSSGFDRNNIAMLTDNNSTETMNSILSGKQTMNIIGFKSNYSGEQSILHSISNIRPVIKINKSNLIYELGIPLESFEKGLVDNLNKYSIGINILALKRPDGAAIGMMGSGIMPSSGMMPPAGMNFPGNEMNFMEIQKLFEENKIWYNCHFSKKTNH